MPPLITTKSSNCSKELHYPSINEADIMELLNIMQPWKEGTSGTAWMNSEDICKEKSQAQNWQMLRDSTQMSGIWKSKVYGNVGRLVAAGGGDWESDLWQDDSWVQGPVMGNEDILKPTVKLTTMMHVCSSGSPAGC